MNVCTVTDARHDAGTHTTQVHRDIATRKYIRLGRPSSACYRGSRDPHFLSPGGAGEDDEEGSGAASEAGAGVLILNEAGDARLRISTLSTAPVKRGTKVAIRARALSREVSNTSSSSLCPRKSQRDLSTLERPSRKCSVCASVRARPSTRTDSSAGAAISNCE